MRVNKWQMNRAGILNYWYYDEAEFEFAGGRLLLRKTSLNGVTLAVAAENLVLDFARTGLKTD